MNKLEEKWDQPSLLTNLLTAYVGACLTQHTVAVVIYNIVKNNSFF